MGRKGGAEEGNRVGGQARGVAVRDHKIGNWERVWESHEQCPPI